MGGRRGRSLKRGGERRRCRVGVAEGAVRPLLNGGKAAGALTAWSPWQLRGSFLAARLESLFLRARWLEDAPERPGCGGGGGGGRVGSGAGVERRRRRRREGPNGVNSPGGGGGRVASREKAGGRGRLCGGRARETSPPPFASDSLLNMGAFLDKPKTEKHNAHGAGNGLRYGLSSMQGWRVEMEDAHTAVVGIPHGLENWSFFAVYDGHAGSRVANYCSTHLLEHITTNEDFRAAGTAGSALEPSVENVKTGIRTGFLKIDEYMRNFSDLRNGMDRSGSTAVGVLISPTHIYFINCGDSRAVLCRDGEVCFSTQDHKPCNPMEKERIQNAGGSVMIQRVNGSLAVSRALGDYDYKCVDGKGPTEQLVSPEPEVYEILRAEEDEFVVLACDGIWDVMSNEELCEFVKSRLEVSQDLENVCNWVVDTCLHKGSRDNMSIVLVCFSNAPKVSDEAVKKDSELDKYLESRVEEIMEKPGEEGMPDLAHVIRVLSAENIPNLPPGGGLAGKRNVIEAVYSRLNPHRDSDGMAVLGTSICKPS
ncbi:protein phosphatase 1B isoform X3 [Phodopus roborovskii]|uniref:protein phosphatase 1B isoform X3 n=1 Tax=Phodopus roborovskii TaxID=109678 RepID=UPI0021E447AC|nr:protein phosphatase 1B isoform X3 [Phodopus roborovskii]